MDTNSNGGTGGPHVPAEAPADAGTATEPRVRAAAVCVRDARKTYPLNKTPVLDGLNMSVAEGTIYGLLGASGCGKTTLLTCIVGRRALNEGTIKVLGRTPGAKGSGLPGPTVGYMPQEMALHSRFTVTETFRFFGWISGMTKEEIERRTDELTKLLDIPFNSRLVGELSGGQQRRVSLGVALLNRPPVLILDEPTVGVDPTLRQSIWDLLLAETQSGRTTVIITTHYIEEARQSHKVGLMRNGTLLDEDSPDRLLARYRCDSMEDVFLKLSVRQHRQRHQEDGSHGIQMVTTAALKEAELPDDIQMPPPPDKVVDDPSLLKTKSIDLKGHNNVMACTWKMAVFTWRNISVIAVLAGLPIIICLLFGYAVGGQPSGLHLAIVNEDYACADGLPAFPKDCDLESPQGLSCRYLRRIDKAGMFILDEYKDVELAMRAVRAGKAWGTLHFPSNYSESLHGRYRDGKDAEDAVLEFSEVSVWLDMSNQQVSDLARTELGRTALQYFDDVVRGCRGNPNIKAIPMQFNDAVYGSFDFDFRTFFAPAVILSVVYNVMCMYTLAGFIDDKKDGFMERSISQGVSTLEILGAHVILDSIMMAVVSAITLAVICGFLNTANLGSAWLLIFLTVIHGYCGMFQGYFIASLFATDFEATFCAMAFYFPTLFLSGLMWPVEGMHWLLRDAVWLLPLNLATSGIRSIMNRGWGLDRVEVQHGFVSAVFWLGFFILITVATLRFKKNLVH